MNRLKRRRGEALWESVFSAVAFAVATLILVSAFGMNAQAQVSVQTQYDLLAVNAFVSDVYEMYKAGAQVSIAGEEDDTGKSSFVATMVTNTGSSKSLSYDAMSQWVSLDGVKLFKASTLEFSQAGQSLYMAIKLKEQHTLELEVFR